LPRSCQTKPVSYSSTALFPLLLADKLRHFVNGSGGHFFLREMAAIVECHQLGILDELAHFDTGCERNERVLCTPQNQRWYVDLAQVWLNRKHRKLSACSQRSQLSAACLQWTIIICHAVVSDFGLVVKTFRQTLAHQFVRGQ